MRDRIQKRVVLLIAPYLSHEKDRIQDQARDDEGEENYPDHEKHNLARIQEDPSDVQSNCQTGKGYPESKEKYCCLSAAHL
jgi:hypothetical protein